MFIEMLPSKRKGPHGRRFKGFGISVYERNRKTAHTTPTYMAVTVDNETMAELGWPTKGRIGVAMGTGANAGQMRLAPHPAGYTLSDTSTGTHVLFITPKNGAIVRNKVGRTQAQYVQDGSAVVLTMPPGILAEPTPEEPGTRTFTLAEVNALLASRK